MAMLALLGVLRVLIFLICAAWICIWILKPTNLWTRAWKEAEERSSKLVFGHYGLDFVVYTFPIIVVAIIGFFYMSFQQGEPRKRQARRSKYNFSNPVIVNSLIGTISAAEILAVFLFAIFLAWIFYARISNDFKKLEPVKSLKLNMWQLKFLKVATRFGLLAEACLALLLLPVLRGMAVFRLLKVQFEASVRYHIWLGTAMVLFATVHGLSTLFIWSVSHNIQDEMWKWQKTGRIYLAGEIALVTALVIWITSLPQIRRKKFQLFYYTHHLYIAFLILFLFHGGDRHFYTVFAGIFLFGLDRLLRIIHSRPETCILSAQLFPCKAIELTLPKDPRLNYTPTSIIFITIPSISALQWHPFSIISSSNINGSTLSVIIKCEGWWTSSLHQMIHDEMNTDTDKMKCIPVSIEGPYGPALFDYQKYDNLLLIAGGVGITPFLSILHEIASGQGKSICRTPAQIQLVYVVKKCEHISLLKSVSSLLRSQQWKQTNLKLKIFVTQENLNGATVSELLNEQCQTQIVHFNTGCSNYATYGLESLTWIGIVAGLSSIVFLVFLVVLNHVFVPPERHPKHKSKVSKEKIPSTYTDLLLLSSFIMSLIFGALVFIIPRLRRLKEGIPQVSHRRKKATESASIELRHALEEHEIHFGRRPDMQDILSKFSDENEGSNMGVLVCGPESMKESVASTCRLSYRSRSNDKKPYYTFHSLNFTL